MAYNQQEKDNRPRAPFDLFSLTRWAKSTAQGKSASFNLDVDLAGRVSLMVRTGDPADKERMRDGDNIRIKLNLEDYEKWVIQFGEAIRHKGECKFVLVEQVRFSWDNNLKKRVPLEAPRDGIKLFFGKDSNGVFYMSLIQFKKTEIEFGFINERPEFIFKHGDGNAFTDAENSLIGARAYHKLLLELHQRITQSRLLQNAKPDDYKPPYVPAQGQGGGQGGGQSNNGGNRSGGNSGGGNGGGQSNGGGGTAKASPEFSDMDDDIPY
jgi:uncharacterized membrane protein YgcG